METGVTWLHDRSCRKAIQSIWDKLTSVSSSLSGCIKLFCSAIRLQRIVTNLLICTFPNPLTYLPSYDMIMTITITYRTSNNWWTLCKTEGGDDKSESRPPCSYLKLCNRKQPNIICTHGSSTCLVVRLSAHLFIYLPIGLLYLPSRPSICPFVHLFAYRAPLPA